MRFPVITKDGQLELAVLVAAAIPRIWLAFADQGVFWPDEIFQSLEPAHLFAFGYAFVPWEFQDGARSWLYPGLLGLLWKALDSLGVSSSPPLVVSAKLLMVLAGLVALWAAMRLARHWGGHSAAVLTGVLGAAFPPSLLFGARCMTEMASAPLIVGAVLLLVAGDKKKAGIAGALVAVACFLRYQNGLFAVGFLIVLLARRRFRSAAYYAVIGSAVGLAGGILDWVTWGAPFHSFVQYVRYNLIEGKAALYGMEPATFYLTTAWSAIGPAVLALIVGLVASGWRALGFLLVSVFYVLAHSLVVHKELRFLMPVVPLMLALAGAGLAAVGRRFAQWTWPFAAALSVLLGIRAHGMTFADLGQVGRGPLSGPKTVWREGDAINRLLWKAGAQPDLCGLLLVGYGEIWSGGYSYLHRDVPLLSMSARPAFESGSLGPLGTTANHIIAPTRLGSAVGYVPLATEGAWELSKRHGACAPPPANFTRLLPK